MIDNIYSITPQQINYILELNAERNFQRASEKCFVTQPTLSMQVKKAEDLLGFPIFDRSRFPIELTSAGEQLIPVLMDVQLEYARIGTLAQRIKGSYSEQLRVGIIPTVSAYLIADVFEAVRREMPHIQIKLEEMKTDEVVDALEENRVDLGILAGPYNERRMRTIPLYQEEIMLYFPAVKSKTVTPEELEDAQPWLLSKGNCLRTQMVHFCSLDDSREFETKWNYEGGNIELLMKMVDLNGGYTLIPQHYRMSGIALKRLYDKRTGEYPAREIIAIMPSKSLKKSSCEAFVRIIQHQYNQEKKASGLRILNWR